MNFEQKKGRVHSIETFGTVDGPGIRCVIFMQGCPLECVYCHNPDTWDSGCGRAKMVTVSGLLDEVLKYRTFFNVSGGGVTISGGEPLLQKDFLLDFLRACKREGLHTCLDTSGFVKIDETVRSLLGYVDLVLFDVKSAVGATYKNVTGQDIGLSLEFMRTLEEMKILSWVRFVLIPNITDGEEEIRAFGKLVAGFVNIEKVELLPFHQLGAHKWDGKDYKLRNTREANADDVQRAKELLKEFGLPF